MADGGGQAVVQVPFEKFVEFAKTHAVLRPSSASQVNCVASIRGERAELQFINGNLSLELNIGPGETLVTVAFASDLEKNLKGNEAEAIINTFAGMINQNLDSKASAKVATHRMLAQLDTPFLGGGREKPEFARKFSEACSDGLTMFDAGYQEALQRNLGLDSLFSKHPQSERALDIFRQALGEFIDEEIKLQIGWGLVERTISHWELLEPAAS